MDEVKRDAASELPDGINPYLLVRVRRYRPLASYGYQDFEES